MDTIFVEEMLCRGVHGATERERKKSQWFNVSVEVDVVDTRDAAMSDKIERATNYCVIWRIVRDVIVLGPSRNLLEALAHKIVVEIFACLPAVQVVRVRIAKMKIWKNARPGVILRRTREGME